MSKRYIEQYMKAKGHVLINHPINKLISQIDKNAVLTYSHALKQYCVTTKAGGNEKTLHRNKVR